MKLCPLKGLPEVLVQPLSDVLAKHGCAGAGHGDPAGKQTLLLPSWAAFSKSVLATSGFLMVLMVCFSVHRGQSTVNK